MWHNITESSGFLQPCFPKFLTYIASCMAVTGHTFVYQAVTSLLGPIHGHILRQMQSRNNDYRCNCCGILRKRHPPSSSSSSSSVMQQPKLSPHLFKNVLAAFSVHSSPPPVFQRPPSILSVSILVSPALCTLDLVIRIPFGISYSSILVMWYALCNLPSSYYSLNTWRLQNW
jgi:hypothetical protein